MKKKQRRPISRNMLRALAVIFSANQILHLEENGLAVKNQNEPTASDPSSAAVQFDQDIQFDISQQDMIEAKKAIDELEKISMNVLKSVKMGKAETSFFIEKSNVLIETFLSSGILEKGISPHLSFVQILFTYFADGKSKKQDPIFDPISSSSLYDEVLVRFEQSHIFDWKAHAGSALLALNKGAGLSIAEYSAKNDTDLDADKEKDYAKN